ncbi:MAG: 1,4-beta-xylanase [Solirubrobacterales bacterium]|nr:1,4-beta-xylanase [Solirubrobacterales bacterium]
MSRRLRRWILLAPVVFVVLATLGAIAAHHDAQKGPDAQPLPGLGLGRLAAARGILLGTALDDGALQHEPGYRHVLGTEFDAITPENAMKWDAVEPKQGELHWDAADRAVDFAGRHRLKVRGHTLVWYSQLPGWLADGGFKAPALRRLMTDHITTEMRRYRGRVRTWDVVNEAMADGGGLRPGLWLDTLGPSYIAEAFAAARKADPDARLALNEIGADGSGPKADTLLKVVRELKRRGLIDEVGFQAHFNLNGVPPSMAQNLRRFSDLGVDVAITEADVSVKDPGTPEQLKVQAEVYGDLVRVCRSVPRCRALTVWGFTDRHSWIPSSSPGYGSATLLDDELKPKPAYAAFQAALRAP